MNSQERRQRRSKTQAQVGAVESYTATIAVAMWRVLGQDTADTASAQENHNEMGLRALFAEQGFAGAFSERILDSIRAKTGDISGDAPQCAARGDHG